MSEDTRRLRLELLGEGAGFAELPRAGVLTIGSDASKVGFTVSGQGVAAVHCAIGRAKGGGFALKDLGSEYGTFVNGERVQQSKLDVGDVILLGSRRLRVVDPTKPAQPTPAVASAPSAVESAPKAAPKTADVARVAEAPARPSIAGTSYEQSPLPKIPGYRLEKLLGRGGMGEVFLATQERLDRKVALKLLSAKLCADADFVRRFQEEARAAAALTHPNVVVVHDVGVEAGRHYLSMEFMDRGTLETRIARGGRMSWTEVLGVLHDMASALVFAEGRGIVHRDLKPANMMQSEAGVTKLADLGLATQIEAEASESENGRIFGTPHFIAPEQARGERVDGRADLYSLGATAYRLLSGRTPFEGATTRDILRGHFFDTPKPLTEFDPAIPAEVVRIVDRLLQKKPDDRFPSAGALLTEVDRVRATLLHTTADAASARGSKLPLLAAGALVVGAAAWWFLRDGSDPTQSGPLDPGRTHSGGTVAQGATGASNSDVGGPAGVPGDSAAALPGDAAANGSQTGPATAGSGDDDTKVKLFEAQAKLAWRDLPVDLTGVDRAKRLRELAAQFAGTSAAVDMEAEAAELEGVASRESDQLAQRNVARQATLGKFEAALTAHPSDPQAAVAAWNALETPAEDAADGEFIAQRAALARRFLAELLRSARAELETIELAATAGDFAAVEQRWTALLATLAPLDLSGVDTTTIPEHGELGAMAREGRRRLDGLAAERERFATAQVDGDRRRIAAQFGTGGAIEAELSRLEFAALHARLKELSASLATEAARAGVLALDEDLIAAEAALRAVRAEFANNGWKREQVADPRGGRSSVRKALSIDDAGIGVEVDGRTELVPWSAFGARPRELNFLFHERLQRVYAPAELAGIETLLRHAAVLAAVEAASEMFDEKSNARFDKSEQAELLAGFDWGRPWAQQAGRIGPFERESRAAAVLAQSLLDASQDAWSASVAGLERLLTEFPDTLLVRLLSDGQGSTNGR